jgi:hypothetical protein
MSERPEPLVYPSRRFQDYPYDPGVPNRQLWALGMIIVQWGMTEFIIDGHTTYLIGNDQALREQRKEVRSAQQEVEFFRRVLETKLEEPKRSRALDLVTRIKNLNSQRDDVVHRLWGGGLEGGRPPFENLKSADAALLKNPYEPRNIKAPLAGALVWKLDFARLRRMAREMAALHRDLMMTLYDLPTGQSASQTISP